MISILFSEDDQSIREITAELFEYEGCSAETASNACISLEKINS